MTYELPYTQDGPDQSKAEKLDSDHEDQGRIDLPQQNELMLAEVKDDSAIELEIVGGVESIDSQKQKEKIAELKKKLVSEAEIKEGVPEDSSKDKVIDVESEVTVSKVGLGRKAGQWLKSKAGSFIKAVLPTPMTHEKARHLVGRHDQLEKEYDFWTAEANRVTARLTAVELEIKQNPGLKNSLKSELKRLYSEQETIRKSQAERENQLYPLRDKVRQAQTYIRNQDKSSEHAREVVAQKNADAILEANMKTDMFNGERWAEAWNDKFEAIFKINLPLLKNIGEKKGMGIRFIEVNGEGFESTIWDLYQTYYTGSVKVNRLQFHAMVKEVLKSLNNA